MAGATVEGYQRIVVPLDGSERAESVLPHVRGLVRPRQTRIYLLSVIATGLSDRAVALLTSYPPGLQLSATALERAQAELTLYLRSVAASLRDLGVVVSFEIRRGNPAEEILAFAGEVEADLVAMTANEFAGLNRWVYGNVASRVLQNATCPVLLVRTPRQEKQRSYKQR